MDQLHLSKFLKTVVYPFSSTFSPFSFLSFVIDMINNIIRQNFVLSYSVCNHTRDLTNRTPATRSSDFVNHLYDYRPNWTPLSPITIMN